MTRLVLIIFWLVTLSGVTYPANSGHAFELVSEYEAYDEPQIDPSEFIAEAYRLGYAGDRRMPEEGLLDVAAKRRPQVGFETSPGIFVRICLNGERFKLGHPPRLFLFIENKTGGPITLLERGSLVWASVAAKLRGPMGNAKPTVLYEFQQEMASRDRRAQMRARRRDGDIELLYSGWIEAAFGPLVPGKYTLDVQVQPENLYRISNPITPPQQSFVFEVLSERHRFYTNGLLIPTLAFMKTAEQWDQKRTFESEMKILVDGGNPGTAPLQSSPSQPPEIEDLNPRSLPLGPSVGVGVPEIAPAPGPAPTPGSLETAPYAGRTLFVAIALFASLIVALWFIRRR